MNDPTRLPRTSYKRTMAMTVVGGLLATAVLLPQQDAVAADFREEVLVHYDMTHEGNTLLDVSGRDRHATIRGSLNGFSSQGDDRVLSFDGTTYVELPDVVQNNKSISIELRYKSGSRSNEGLFSLGTTSDRDYFRFNPNVNGSYFWESKLGNQYTKRGDRATVAADGWTTSTAVMRPDPSFTVAMNGVLADSEAIGQAAPHFAGQNPGGTSGYLGRPVWRGDPFFTGTVTDVIIRTVDTPTVPDSSNTKVVSHTFPALGDGSRWWRSSMITGNGENGALVAGNPLSDTHIYQNIAFNLPNPDRRTTPDLTGYLRDNRRALVEGRDARIDSSWRMQWDYGFHPGHQMRVQIPGNGVVAGHNRWTDYETGEIGVEYTAPDGATWERRTFASRADNVVVTHFTRSSSNQPISLNLDITPIDNMAAESGWINDQLRYKQFADPEGDHFGQVVHYPAYANSELASAGYAGVTSVIAKGGTKTVRATPATGQRAVAGSSLYGVDIAGADEVFLVTRSARDLDMGSYSAFPAQNDFPVVDELVSGIAGVTSDAAYQSNGALDYDKLIAPHIALHGEEFNAVSLDLPASAADSRLTNEALIAKQQASPTSLNAAMLERSFAAGRYATISSSGYSVPRLGGMWIGAWNPAWQGDWTLDANVNLQIAGANIGALPSEMNGYVNFLLRILPEFESNAQRIYGMQNALLAPPRTDGDTGALYHFSGNGEPYPFQYWNSGASWLILPLYEYWLVNGNVDVPLAADVDVSELASVLSAIDTDLTAQDVARIQSRGSLRLADDLLLPLLRKQSNFWEQLVDPEFYVDTNGKATFTEGKTTLAGGEKYLLLPCYSPENAPAGAPSPIAMNCSMDIAAALDGLRMTMAIESAVGQVTPGGRWQKLADNLPPVTYDAPTGALKEWSLDRYREQHAHRHVSQAYFAWPAHDSQASKTIAEGLSKTVELRKATAGDKSSGHGWLHMALVDARLKNAEGVTDSLHALLAGRAYYSSFTTDHNVTGDSGYVSDILNTVPAVLLESVAYSDRGVVEILPAVPGGMDQGSVDGSLLRTRAELSKLTWDLPSNTATAVIKSEIDQTIKLSSGQPWVSATIDDREYRNTGAAIPVAFMAGQTSTIVFALGEPEEPTPSLVTTETSAATRCIAGRVTLTATVKNTSAMPVSIEVTSTYGKKSIASLAPGKSVSQAFTTRQGQITSGEVTITAAGQVDGSTVTATQKAGYDARSCG